MNRRNYACVPCRYANRTGVSCPTCGEQTRRVYGRVPRRGDDKAWARLRRLYWTWDNALPLSVRRGIALAAQWRLR